jgi:hypothetical protein
VEACGILFFCSCDLFFLLLKPGQQDIDGHCVSDGNWLQITVAFLGAVCTDCTFVSI